MLLSLICNRLEINENEADVIRRIFEKSASGMSLKRIATELNSEKIHPPRPRAAGVRATWAPTAIREMLRRELYRGQMIWNRSHFIKVPGTNKRVARPRPRGDWQISERPELRIVSDELWQAVQARQSRMQELYGGKSGLLNRSASSGHFLTGFIKCGSCGANLVIVTGRKRRHATYGCPQHWYRGACPNGLTHELSHTVLEHEPTPVAQANGHRYWNGDVEDEATWLGAVLLVPREGALAMLKSDWTVSEMAEHFGVSESLCRWRITQCGVDKQVERWRRYR